MRATIARASAPLAILLVPFAISVGLVKAHGYDAPLDGPLVIGTMMQFSPAEAAGIEIGDTLLEVDGHEITDLSSLRDAVQGRAGQPLHAVIERDGSRRELTIVPESRDGHTVIGITPAMRTVHRSIGLAHAARIPVLSLIDSWSVWAEFLTSPSAETLQGPIGLSRAMTIIPDALTRAVSVSLILASWAPLVALLSSIGQIRMALRARRQARALTR